MSSIKLYYLGKTCPDNLKYYSGFNISIICPPSTSVTNWMSVGSNSLSFETYFRFLHHITAWREFVYSPEKINECIICEDHLDCVSFDFSKLSSYRMNFAHLSIADNGPIAYYLTLKYAIRLLEIYDRPLKYISMVHDSSFLEDSRGTLELFFLKSDDPNIT